LQKLLKKLNKKIKAVRRASKGKIPKLRGKGKKLNMKINKLMAKKAMVLKSIGTTNRKIIKLTQGPDHMKDPINRKN